MIERRDEPHLAVNAPRPAHLSVHGSLVLVDSLYVGGALLVVLLLLAANLRMAFTALLGWLQVPPHPLHHTE